MYFGVVFQRVDINDIHYPVDKCGQNTCYYNAIHWMAIYQMNCVIHLLNNLGLFTL